MLLPDQSRMIESPQFTYSPLRKAFEKEFANWRACVLSRFAWFTCLACSRALRARVLGVLYVLACLACLRAWRAS